MIDHHALVPVSILPGFTFRQLQTMTKLHPALNRRNLEVGRCPLSRNHILIPEDEDIAVLSE